MSKSYAYRQIIFKSKRPNVFKRLWKAFWEIGGHYD